MAAITISVTDPTKCSEGFANSYISYKVHSNTTRPGFEAGSHSVVRRFSDFAWLSQELAREFPGMIVPPIPEKLTVGRFGEDFVESRRRALEKFLQRVASHQELSNSQYFIVFLQSTEAGLSEAKSESKAKATKSNSSISWLEGTVNKVTAGGKVPNLERSAADIKTDEINQYITALEKQLVNVTKHAESLVKRSRETAITFFEFGQSFTFLGQSEGDTVGAALSQLGNTADNLAGSAHTFAEAEVIKLVEPLEEYTRMLQSIKTAIGQRNTKKFAYVNCLIDVEAKTQAYQKLQGVPGKEAQAEQKQQAVTTAQDGADAAKAEFEKVSERLLTEFELFKNQKAFDIKEIMTNFVNLQIEFNRQSEDFWAKLIPSIENVVVEDPYQVRSTAQSQSTSDSRVPEHNFTRPGGNSNVSFAPTSAPPRAPQSAPPSARANPYGDEGDEPSYPTPPSFPPPATPPASNPFGEDSQGVRKQSYAFTDEEGEGGDEDVEEV
eukprot:CAMPEP_0170387430 /NCGR_PEP_ID=MMETSP0117_2-20130122/17553_1 /TAXON_ID=400756 /ORGANISM="Durinskia baltica, Strain CSIRO CS-38" /LENGTH=494 /DNA_ID=CAMNT_0010643297 /DNA_START=72 /DNA_END=1556 /DNA_ORIENTATION=+